MKSFANSRMVALAALALVGCASIPEPAEAATVVVSWTNPVTNVDGSPVPANSGNLEALASWRFEYGTCGAGGAFGTRAGEFIRTRAPNGPPLTSTTQNLPAGLTCVRAFVRNEAGNESDASNVASREVPASKPGPPTNVTVALQQTT